MHTNAKYIYPSPPLSLSVSYRALWLWHFKLHSSHFLSLRTLLRSLRPKRRAPLLYTLCCATGKGNPGTPFPRHIPFTSGWRPKSPCLGGITAWLSAGCWSLKDVDNPIFLSSASQGCFSGRDVTRRGASLSFPGFDRCPDIRHKFTDRW